MRNEWKKLKIATLPPGGSKPLLDFAVRSGRDLE